MKLSKNFVKDYVDIDVDIKTLAEDMTRVGNEYDSAEKLINATHLVIGEVIECEEHPDSDHLSRDIPYLRMQERRVSSWMPSIRGFVRTVDLSPNRRLKMSCTVSENTVPRMSGTAVPAAIIPAGKRHGPSSTAMPTSTSVSRICGSAPRPCPTRSSGTARRESWS